MTDDEVHKGLDGVVMDESTVGKVDGEHGNLWYRGYNIDDLVEHASYEETVHLLLEGELPTQDELDAFRREMAEHRALPAAVRETVTDMAPTAQPMDVLRTAVSQLAMADDAPEDLSAVDEKALRVIAKVPTIVAATHRAANGEDLVTPDPDLGHAANFLSMLHGEQPSEDAAAAMDAALILYAEHGMNASTFAGVVTASTEANVYSALTSAIGALQGPLHGGATETVIEMLEDVGGADNADDWVQGKVDAHELIPGFGHRVYQVTDPRCAHFKAHIDRLKGDGDSDWVDTIEAVRDAVEQRLGEKGIWPNTDLYSGTLYRLLGIPSPLYTALFATARVAGWSAHVEEQLADNRIIRPRVTYTGDLDRDWVPLDER